MIDEMQRAGYALAETHGFLPHQYFLVFRSRWTGHRYGRRGTWWQWLLVNC
ncbi:MAG: hypothetical protein NZL99_07630 [Burkholderiaceae bacterium]|nr:hypothetical protein [Burkholderiaceae bacterium]MCX8005669.1 hypothetical protein [Burkholderiaceae bacterium]